MRPADQILWNTALDLGLIDEDVLGELIRERGSDDFRGKLGQVLVEKGLLTAKQLEALHRRMGTQPEEDDADQQGEDIAAAPTMMLDDEELEDMSLDGMGRTVNLEDETVGGGNVDDAFTVHLEDKTELIVDDRTVADVEGKTVPDIQVASGGQSVSGQSSTKSLTAAQISKARQMSAEDVKRLRRVASGEGESLMGVNLGGYRVDDKLGAGGMGDVFLATQLSLNRQVALKVLPQQMAQNEDFIERFYREARTLATVTHTNIVQVYDVGMAEGVHFFTMEQVVGQTFKDLMNESGTVPMEVCTNLLKQSIKGLDRALKAGVVHRDIKPGNILINEAGDVKIVDFGLAETVEDGSFKSEQVVGTPLYIAPEQASSQPVTFKSDMYSLGATFFHLATGQPPFRGKSAYETTRMHIELPLPNPSDINSAIPPAFSAILRKMMEKDPNNRYRTWKELFEAVEEFEIAAGIIKSRTDFLADGLLAIGDKGVRALGVKIGFMSIVGGSIALLALGIHNLLKSRAMRDWIAMTGDLGTILFVLAVLFITYVAMARKRIVPTFGEIRTWMYAHIFCAIASFFLVTIHSGNFFRWFLNPLNNGAKSVTYPDGRTIYDQIPLIPFLNSFVFFIVIVSGLVGATIWRDVVKQVTVERIASGKKAPKQDTRMTMSVFSQTVFKYWRMIHYPLAVALGLLTLLHVVSILWYRGGW